MKRSPLDPYDVPLQIMYRTCHNHWSGSFVTATSSHVILGIIVVVSRRVGKEGVKVVIVIATSVVSSEGGWLGKEGTGSGSWVRGVAVR